MSKNALYFNRTEGVVMPQDLYYEQTDIARNVFGLYDYLPLVREGELEHLIALINNSPTALSICNKVAAYTVGEGFYLLKEKRVFGEKQSQELTEEQKTTLWRILNRKNSDGDTVLDVCRKAAFDFQALGNTFAQLDVIRDVVFVSHMNANFVRPFRSQTLKTHYFGISPDWAILPYTSTQRTANRETNIPASIVDIPIYPAFTSELWEAEEIEYGIGANAAEVFGFDKSSMLHVKRYSPLMYQWGLPSWISAKHAAELEYRIMKFNVSRFRNGLTTSGLLQVFGDLTEEEKDAYQKDFFDKMTGTGNDFKVIFQILENPELKANWIPFENNYTGYFMELADLAKDRIATAFEFPLSLVQATAGQLGNNQQIRSEFEILYRTKIYDIQQAILTGIVKPYLDTVAEVEGILWLANVELGFLNVVPVSFAGDIDVNEAITKNEAREISGFPALEEPQADTLIEQPQPEAKPVSMAQKFVNFFKRKKP